MPLSLKLLRAGRRPVTVLPDALDIAGQSVPLLVRRHPRAKRLTLRLKGDGLAVTAPPRASAAAILDFLERHRGWAASRIGQVASRTVVADGSVLPFRGGSLRIVHEAGRRAARFERCGDDVRLLVGGDPAHLSRRVVDALKREARGDLQSAVDRHAATLAIKPKSMTLKDTKSRWGSCTADRRLAFSWRIVMAPTAVLDYLAAHEVAHLREMNHGAGFWSLCRTLCPAMDEGRAWLKAHGASLHAIDFGR